MAAVRCGIVVAMVEPDETRERWWQQRTPSVVVFCVVVAAMGLAGLLLASEMTEVLPEVGRDQLGDDNWVDPIGVESAFGYTVAHVPDCAAGAVTRIVLWDADSTPYWEAVAMPTPLESFVVGAAPEGFLTTREYEEPPRGAVLRLVIFRKVGGAAGVRYRQADLREERVMSMVPLQPFTIEGFKTARVCGDGSGVTDDRRTGDGSVEIGAARAETPPG